MDFTQRFLVVYSGVLTLALGVIVLTGASAAGNASFDTIEVQRIEALPEPEREAARDALFAENAAQGGALKQRVFVGKNRGQESVVALSGADGKPRLLLEVTPEGEARIAFLDADGKEVGSITPESLAR